MTKHKITAHEALFISSDGELLARSATGAFRKLGECELPGFRAFGQKLIDAAPEKSPLVCIPSYIIEAPPDEQGTVGRITDLECPPDEDESPPTEKPKPKRGRKPKAKGTNGGD